MSENDQSSISGESSGEFVTTHWSIVLRAGNLQSENEENNDAKEAMAILCQKYWLPLYAYARRHLSDIHQAQDLTQDFFAGLIEKNVLTRAAPERGRFRSFLLTSLKNFIANEWDRIRALKRGGRCKVVSLDMEGCEDRILSELAHEMTAEKHFERQWAMTLLENVLSRMQSELIRDGKQRQFELLKGTLAGERSDVSYTRIAADLRITEEAARQVAHRFRRRYREILRDEVLQTVGDSSEVDDELRKLFDTLSC